MPSVGTRLTPFNYYFCWFFLINISKKIKILYSLIHVVITNFVNLQGNYNLFPTLLKCHACEIFQDITPANFLNRSQLKECTTHYKF